MDTDYLISRNPVKFRSSFIKIGARNDEIDEKFEHFLHFSEKSLAEFFQNFEIEAVQKYVYLVDLEKCCKMSIWLRNLASIQQRTSLDKFCILGLKNWS